MAVPACLICLFGTTGLANPSRRGCRTREYTAQTPHCQQTLRGVPGNQSRIINEARGKFQCAVSMSCRIGLIAYNPPLIPECAARAIYPAIGHAGPLSTGIVQVRSTAPMLSPERSRSDFVQAGEADKLQKHSDMHTARWCAG
jgi:hypothetical protein